MRASGSPSGSPFAVPSLSDHTQPISGRVAMPSLADRADRELMEDDWASRGEVRARILGRDAGGARRVLPRGNPDQYSDLDDDWVTNASR